MIERGLETLHGHVRGRRQPSRRRLLLQCSLVSLLEAAVCVLWLCFVLVPGQFDHPHYLVIMHLPGALRVSTGYWCAFAFQVRVMVSRLVSPAVMVSRLVSPAVMVSRLVSPAVMVSRTYPSDWSPRLLGWSPR